MQEAIRKDLAYYGSLLEDRLGACSGAEARAGMNLRTMEATLARQREELQGAAAKIGQLEALLEERAATIVSYKGVIRDLMTVGGGAAGAAAGTSVGQ